MASEGATQAAAAIIPNVDFIFLGVADIVGQEPQHQQGLVIQNIIGLRTWIGALFLPVPVGRLKKVVAIRKSAIARCPNFTIEIVAPSGRHLSQLRVELSAHEGAPPAPSDTPLDDMRLDFNEEWQVWSLPFPALAWAIEFGHFSVRIVEPDGTATTLGSIYIAPLVPEPLSEEEVAAIRASPRGVRTIAFEFACAKCESSFAVWGGIDRVGKAPRPDFVWYSEVENEYECSCGNTRFDTRPLRTNFLSSLRTEGFQRDDAQLQLAERVAIRDTASRFEQLLQADEGEEAVQKFIEANTILFNRFTPKKIFFKRPILSKYKTDFAVLTHRDELLLIEIERPSTTLLTNSGQVSAQLQHALDQVLTWLREIENHRAAVLEGIGVSPTHVSRITGVVIAGRDSDLSSENLRKLRWMDFHRAIEVLTFDDLLGDLLVLSRGLGGLRPRALPSANPTS